MPAEHLQPQEKHTARATQTQAVSDTLPTTAMVESLFADRRQMFASFERYLPVRMREYIREKLAQEQQTLQEIIERQRAARARAQKAVHVLHKSYFKHKKLDVSSFE